MDKTFLDHLNETAQKFSGWDFSYISETGRMQNGALSWSFGSLASRLIRQSEALLDMGTGGGELLSKLQPFPKTVCATEAYKPNIPIAKNRLEPLGVQVFGIEEDEALPFADNEFDLIINRHEAYSASEVKRILKDGGVFLTQQVGGDNCAGINEALGAPMTEEFSHWNLDYAVKELSDEGFTVEMAKEEALPERFYDIGALIYYLNAVPWQIENFTVADYKEKLYGVHQKIEAAGYFEVKETRFIIKAQI